MARVSKKFHRCHHTSNKEADNIRLLVSETPLHKLTTVIVDYIIQHIKDTSQFPHHHGSDTGNRDTVYMAMAMAMAMYTVSRLLAWEP